MPPEGATTAVRLKVIGIAAVLAAMSVPAFVFGPWPEIPEPPLEIPWWALASLFALTETFVIRFRVRQGSHATSLSEVPFMLGLGMATPVGLVIGRVVGTGAALIIGKRLEFHKVVANLSIVLVETAIGVHVYRAWLAGQSPVSAIGLAVGYMALLVALVVGTILVGSVIRVLRPMEFIPLARTLGSSFLIGVISSVFGMAALALAWLDPLTLIGVAIATAGLYVAAQVYRSMANRFEDLEAMYDFTSSIDGAVDSDDLAEVILSHLRAVFDAAFAEVVLSRGVGSTSTTSTGSGVQRRPAPPAIAGHLVGLVPEGDSVVAMNMADAPETVRAHYAASGVPAGMLAVLGGGAQTASLLVVGERSDGMDYEADDLRLFVALAQQARTSLERGRLVDRLRREIGLKEYQAVHDALTGLPNRLHFTFVVEEAVRGIRPGGRHAAVLLVDLDRFKEVNDTLGHQRGDVLLQEMALRLTDMVGGDETVARLGGDEFGILLRSLDGVNEASDWAEKMAEVLHRPFVNEGLALQVSGSIGIAMAPDHGTDATTLLRRADVAMYQAKERGSSFEVYDPSEDTYSTRRLAMAAELRSAIETDEIVLAYQPKAHISSRSVVGVEALARWPHPRHGMVPPDEFVELAERTGLVKPLTDHVLRTALRDVGRLRSGGIEIGVSINIAASSLSDEAFPDQVRAVLDEFGVPAEVLTLEVTESSMMTDTVRSRQVLASLHEIGVRLAIDDYGTGYSSLTHLSHLPVAEVKIDRSFVMDMAVDERLAKIVSSTTALVHSLGKTVVAEGVESQATWDLLAQAGCDEAQGYFLARPMSLSELRAWLLAGATPAGDPGLRAVSAG